MGDSSVVLAVTSPDGDQGYPGEVKVHVFIGCRVQCN